MSRATVCECRHMNAWHIEDVCFRTQGRGMCKCSEFRPTQNQPYEMMVDFIARHIGEKGYGPTIQAIADHLGLSVASTHGRLERLEQAEVIVRDGRDTKVIAI